MSSSAPPSGDEPTTPKVVLKFNASQLAPDIAEIFRANGGAINAMSVDWETDFSVSGSEYSEWDAFSQGETTQINIEIPESKVRVLGGNVLLMSSSMRLNLMTERVSTAMTGGLGITVACEGSQFLYHILKSGHPSQIPMTYKSFMAHAAAVCVSGARLVIVYADGTETTCTPRFERDPDESAEMTKGVEELVEKYVNTACRIRQTAVVYQPSPTLHKTVFVDTVGVAGHKLSFLHVHEIMDRIAHVSLETINGLFEASIATNFRHYTANINVFLADTAKPGLPAAKRAGEVATATSLVVNTLMSYRADGRNIVTPTGADFVAVESWNRAVPRGSIETNDCDGLALLAVALLRSCINATRDDLAQYAYVKAVRNALYHHYQFGLSVIGASEAEANSADASHSTIAGHAIVLLIPTMSLLKALSRTSSMKIGKDGNPATANGPEIDKLRLRALYHDNLINELPEEEAKNLLEWDPHNDAFRELDAFAIEGTSPATSTLYVKDPVVAKRHASIPVYARSKSGSTHSFYADFVELTFAPDSPLFANKYLRDNCAAASQFVFTSDVTGDTVKSAGCTPRDLVMETYGLFPLIQVGSRCASLMDHVAKVGADNRIPRRKSTSTRLNDYQATSLDNSLKYIHEFKAWLEPEDRAPPGAHAISYICAYNTLVHNPESINQFLNTAKSVALAGKVVITQIPGLASDANRNEMGYFVHIELFVPV